MSKQILTTVAFMLISVFVFAQKNTSGLTTTAGVSGDMYKGEAKNFGLSVMKAYFTNNCDYVYGKMSNIIKTIEGGNQISKKQFSAQDICSEVSIENNATYNMYLDNYEPEVLNAAEFAAKYPAYQNVLRLQKGEYYFGGNVLKPGKSELFMSHDHTRFVIKRLSTNNFAIVAF